MKKLCTILLSALILCSAAGCAASSEKSAASQTDAAATATTAAASTAATETQAASTAPAITLPADVEETVKAHNFEGVLYAVKNGQPIAAYAKGTTENGAAITLDTPLPVGSVSKQFCAAAVLLLQEQGKLNVKDTLDKYYPDYQQGSKITLHNLLSMRSGLPDMRADSGLDVTMEHTEAENVANIKQWAFAQPLTAAPDTAFEYVNLNYFLLADIVEQVSGQRYIDFLREAFFTPLGMTHTGSIIELADDPAWAQGNVYQKVDAEPGLTKGAGDLITNAADITIWLNALSSGKAVSADSFKAMTTDYSPDSHYGYGLFQEEQGGFAHNGNIQAYTAYDYVNTDKNLTLVYISNTLDPAAGNGLTMDLLDDLLS